MLPVVAVEGSDLVPEITEVADWSSWSKNVKMFWSNSPMKFLCKIESSVCMEEEDDRKPNTTKDAAMAWIIEFFYIEGFIGKIYVKLFS